jgi:hypothetical protein
VGTWGNPLKMPWKRHPIAGIESQKLTIPRRFYRNISALLLKANITSKVLYGDLEGLARTIKMTLFAHQ